MGGLIELTSVKEENSRRSVVGTEVTRDAFGSLTSNAVTSVETRLPGVTSADVLFVTHDVSEDSPVLGLR